MINSQAKGKRAERDLVNYLKLGGWPSARRVVRTGDLYAPDEGDVRLDNNGRVVVFEVKHYAGGLTAGQVEAFLGKLQTTQCRPGELGILVERRERVSGPEEWWGWIAWMTFRRLLGVDPKYFPTGTEPVRMRLGGLMCLVTGFLLGADQARRHAGPLTSPLWSQEDSIVTTHAELGSASLDGYARKNLNPFLDDGDTL